MSSFQGIWVPIVTPFQDGAIDFIGLHRLVGHLLEKHVAGIMVCTTTGEAASLSRQEQLAVLDAVLQWVPAQQVVMGLAGNNQIELLHFQSEILQRPAISALPRLALRRFSARWRMPPACRLCSTTFPTAPA